MSLRRHAVPSQANFRFGRVQAQSRKWNKALENKRKAELHKLLQFLKFFFCNFLCILQTKGTGVGALRPQSSASSKHAVGALPVGALPVGASLRQLSGAAEVLPGAPSISDLGLWSAFYVSYWIYWVLCYFMILLAFYSYFMILLNLGLWFWGQEHLIESEAGM